MKVTKPSDTLIILGRQSRGGQPLLTVTVGYVCERDGSRLSEQAAWTWLVPKFPNEPFDIGVKRKRGVFAVAGHAYAPGGVPVTGLTVAATVGTLGKRLLVQGNRSWVRAATGWRASEPQAFLTQDMGLAYAYGARDWPANPYGRGHFIEPGAAEGQMLPNVELPNAPVLSPSDVAPVATFGPLPQGSPDITRWLGKLDQSWERERMPWLPDDTDPRWFDGVPQDQCTTTYWQGNEGWSATHMHATLPEQSGQLPGLRPRLLASAKASPEQSRELPLDLDTVWLFPNDSRVIVLYRAELAVRYEDASDLAGLAVFTEKLSDTALSSEHYAQLWRTAVKTKIKGPAEGVALSAPAGKTGLSAAALAEQSAALAKKAEAHRAGIAQAIATAQKETRAEAQAHFQAYGIKTPLENIPPPSTVSTLASKSTTPMTADAIRSQVKAALNQAQAEARAHLAQYGIDLDQAAAHAQAQPKPDPLALIAVLPVSDIKKAALTAEMKTALGKIDAVEKKAAEIKAKAASLKPADGKTKASANAPPIDDTLPDGPRRKLGRDELMARHRAGLSAAWTELDGEDLSGLDLSGIDLSRARLHACILRGTTLHKARLTEAQLDGCDLDGAHLDQAQLQRAQLADCHLNQASLNAADLTQARLKNCQFTNAKLAATQWRDANADKCGFEHADLTSIQAAKASFSECRLNAANAAEGVLDRARFSKCVMDAACFDHASLAGTTLLGCQAIAASFRQARMQGLRSMAGTNLQQARFDGANLTRASLQNTLLVQASLREACLDQAFIKECDLSASDGWHLVARHADFTGSRIAGASWRGANLMKSRFARAILENIDWSGANLHAASTRTASAQGILLDQALLTRCRLIQEHA
ncbi:DUF2169 family type VI secretion system accessory protein [Paralcaligenes ginsengisoli]